MPNVKEIPSNKNEASSLDVTNIMRAVKADKSANSPAKVAFLEKVRQSNAACQNGDFERAVALYTEAIQLDPANHILYSNRSAAHIKMGQFAKALQDAVKAKELNPEWPKAYYRQGVALQCLAKHGEAIAAFANGLGQDPKSPQLLEGLVEATMKSPLKGMLEPTFRQLESMKLEKSPFVIISVVGQELLAQGQFNNAVEVLESALRIGTCSLKLRGSVFSALSSAYWALNSLEKAIYYMQQDLVVAKSLSDINGECRAHGNLGAAYFSQGNYKEALTSHRYQLVLAMKCKETQAAASALTSLGHVYTATGDFANALASHKQCVELIRSQLDDKLMEAREIGNVGAVYLAMGDFDRAVDCHMEHLKLATALGNRIEEARAYSNLGSSHHYKRNFEQAMFFHEAVLRIALELKDRAIEARAYAGLGHAARCTGDVVQAKQWHEKQLEVALATKDRVAEGRACSNLGIVFQLMGDHDAALKLHQAHLNIARNAQDKAGMGRAFGNIGNAYSASGFFEQAIKYHKQELTISKEVNDRASEAATHGNLAVAYQALEMHDIAMVHYHSHLNLARELKDTAGEACALCNLGNCHSSRGDFTQAVPFYENYLMLSQELNDVEGEAKACHFLGYAHYCLGNYKEAIRYYDQDLVLARDQQDRSNMSRAYCNLGLAHLALGNLDTALECQKYFLALTQATKQHEERFKALGNIGDVLLKMSNIEEAVKAYQKQLIMSKHLKNKKLEAGAYGALGISHRLGKQFDKSLGFHTQELSILQDLNDVRGECKAHANLGAVHLSLANYINAVKCYQEQLERAMEAKDDCLEAEAFGNLGVAKIHLGRHDEAISFFEQQLVALDHAGLSTKGKNLDLEKGRAFGNLGSCYEALGNYEDAVECHEHYLDQSLKCKSLKDQDRAYRELGQAHKSLGNLQQALVCYEKRLVVAHDLSDDTQGEAKGFAYGELGEIHAMLGNHEQAISCMQHQLKAARDLNDKSSEAKASAGLGKVFQSIGDFDEAMKFHQLDFSISSQTDDSVGQIRSLGNLGSTHENLGQIHEAIKMFESQLSISVQVADHAGQTSALANLGRLHFTVGLHDEALSFLEQGLESSLASGKPEDEARIRHQLGQAMWRERKNLDEARLHFELAAKLLTSLRRESCTKNRGQSKVETMSKKQLEWFDLQTECYQYLQKVLVDSGLENEALVIAEISRSRAFVDLQLERHGHQAVNKSKLLDSLTSITERDIINIVNRQKASVIYYSIAADYLLLWLILPTKGIVKFHQVALQQESSNKNAVSDKNILAELIDSTRESLGVEPVIAMDGPEDDNTSNNGILESALSEKLNHDQSGFLRMVNRSSRLNASSYSLSSLFSVGSLNNERTGPGSTYAGSRHGSTRSGRRGNLNHLWQGPSALKQLYQLLIEPLEDDLPEGGELMLILEDDLYLVPFAMLKGVTNPEYLCERFNLIISPSVSCIKLSRENTNKNKDEEEKTNALVVGNPKLPSSIAEQWGWADIPQASREAETIAEILQTSAVTGEKATKSEILSRITGATCIHFACHVSWKLSAIVLSPGEFVESKSTEGSPPAVAPLSKARYALHNETIHEEDGIEDMKSEDDNSTLDMPALSEFLLTAGDILKLKLTAKLVILSNCYNKEERVTPHGVITLTRALLAAGAQCVLVSLWPTTDQAVHVTMKTLYSSLLQGARVSRALSEAMVTVHNTKHFQHPANWAGFSLVGADIKVSNKVALMGQALRDILTSPEKCRDALRVTLHLVEKSLQRINRGYKNAMYTSQKSIENKVGDNIKGWKDLLIAVGFRFEPATNGIPPSVFFPQSDPGERLTQCSASLQALLGLSQTSWMALSKLLSSPEAADEIIALFRQVAVLLSSTSDTGEISSGQQNVQVPVNVKLWRVPGCHELLASLGFDLTEVGKEDVTLRMGKTAYKRQIQFALQALLALFDTQEAPRSLDIDEQDSDIVDGDNVLDYEDNTVGDSFIEEVTSGFPTPKRFGLRTTGNDYSSAFTCYVRKRGEPDGRQAGNGDSPTQPSSLTNNQSGIGLMPQVSVYQNQRMKGHESDCNFTPSPVDTLQRSILFSSPVTGHFHPPNHHHHHNFGTTRQPPSPSRRFLKGVQIPSPLNRPESSSSVSSFNDWEVTPGQNPTLGLRQSLEIRRASGGHFHFPSVQQKIDQALGELSTLGEVSIKQPLYENSRHNMEFSARLPAGRPVVPIRSVFTDVGYQTTQKIMDRSDPNDKFSVRTEYGKSLLASQANSVSSISVGSSSSSTCSGRGRSSEMRLSPASEARLDPGVVKRVPPTGESDSPENTVSRHPEGLRKQSENFGRRDKSLESAEILAAVSSVLKQHPTPKRDPPVISEVYHERSLGLGLAPPLSKLILSNNLQVVQVDHHSDSDSNEKVSPLNSLTATITSLTSKGPSSFCYDGDHESFGNFDNLTAIEDAHQRNSFALANPPIKLPDNHNHPKARPPVPPKPSTTSMSPDTNWYMNTKPSILSPTSPGGNHIHPANHHHGTFNFHQRDEGDGRSMSDSQYSGCSPSGVSGKVVNTKTMKSLTSQMTYMKIGEYLNDQEITVLEEKEVLPKKTAKSFSPVVIESSDFINSPSFKTLDAGKRSKLKSDTRTLLPVNQSNGDIKHPGQLWSRDRNGGLMYTGRFASDC